jgi:DNA-binding NarL/FixJ family response regulator
MPLRVVIIEDNRIVRKCLRKIIDSQADMECVGMATDGLNALPLTLQADPDVILVDRSTPGVDGVENIRRIRHAAPNVWVVGMAAKADECEDLARAGADAVCTKHEAIARIARIIRNVVR